MSGIFNIYPVTEMLLQRLPLIAGAGALCFVLGTLFGAVCAVTIARGVTRRRRNKCMKKPSISPPVLVEPEPTYTELTLPPANTEGERRDNDYIELGVSTDPHTQPLSCSTPNENTSCSGAAACAEATCETAAMCELLPLPPRLSQQRSECSSCIEVDLDELERAVSQQD